MVESKAQEREKLQVQMLQLTCFGKEVLIMRIEKKDKCRDVLDFHK